MREYSPYKNEGELLRAVLGGLPPDATTGTVVEVIMG